MTDETKTTTTETDKPKTEAKPETGFTPDQQKLIDAEIGNARKKAKDAARKELLKELGIEDAEDPKALETVKGKLTIAQQAETAKAAADEAAKTELQKAQDAIATAHKERDEAKQHAAEVEAKRIADKLNGRLESLASQERAIDPADVVVWLRNNKAADVAALMDDKESVNEVEAKKLLAEVRKAKAHWFKGAQGAGSPSMSGGQTPGMDDKEARDKHAKEYRRA